MKIRILSIFLAICACGSEQPPTPPKGPAPAVGLDYQDPVASGWRLVRDPSSTVQRLVLDLVGPAGLKTRGTGFNLVASKVKFGGFDNGLPIDDTGVYQLRSKGSIDPNEPIALAGAVKGSLLTVGIWQKDRDQDAQDSGAPLLRIAIVLDLTAQLKSGTNIPLQIVKAKAMPADIGKVTDPTWLLARELQLADIQIAVGSLTAL
jgi:hypothetical protein